MSRHFGWFVFFAVLLAGCGSLSGLPGPPSHPTPPPAQTPIQHIVIIVQENRTFDNFFKDFPGADSADTGRTHTGGVVALQPVGLDDPHDPCHTHICWVTTYDHGKIDAFDLNNPPETPKTYDYAYVPKSQIQPYWDMARQYTLADRFFQSNSGPSYPAHQYLIAGQSAMAAEVPDEVPWGCDAPSGTTVRVLDAGGNEVPGPFPCFNYRTLADTMDAAGVTWRYYAPSIGGSGSIWSAFDAINHIRFGPDWTQNVVSPQTRILTDVAGGSLAQVTWVVPSAPDSDHPGNGSGGPSWVTAVFNAIGASQYWNNTAIFITWDDWGGWYDHVVPPQLDLMGLGYRVPLVVVSPYAKPHHVSHDQLEFGSILKFIEVDFGLPALTAEDSRAANPSDCFDFSQAPTPFSKISAPVPPSYFVSEPPSSEPPDSD
jgi:phospholipase C